MSVIRKGYVDTPSGQLHYRATAYREGTPLVLLHQTPSASAMYAALLRLLADDFWLIAPDTPGFGQSDPLPQAASIAAYAAAIQAGLVQLGVTACCLFGHHTGASIAVQMAFTHPSFVRKLALSGPPLLTAEQIAHLRATLPPRELDEDGRFLLTLWQRISAKDARVSLPLRLRETTLALQAWASYHEAYDAVFAHDLAGQLAALTCPTLLLAGERDALIASLEPAHRLLPPSIMHILPGAGGYLCDQEPQQLVTVLRTFL